MATIFTPSYYFNCACRDFGLEDRHTIIIARMKERAEQGAITNAEACFVCRCVYAHGIKTPKD